MKHFTFLRFLLFYCCLCVHQIHAQRESSNWVFGLGAGLQFMPDSTIVQFGSSVVSREGVSAASDPTTGELLFYTDGITVWDKTNAVMQNGNSLLGHYSSCQSGVIVPMPGNKKKYYVFTADFLGNTNGYRYSIVNMAANLGLGAVESATKNTLLFQSSSEKLTVAQHCNKRDFWLILREAGNSMFWVYLINETGIQSPKKFSLGASMVNDTWNEVGYLEMSSNQKMLAHAVGPTTVGGASKVEVLNFDNENGTLTGPFVTLPGYYFAYGVEFSPDSKLLYVSDINTPGAASVAQYNVTLGTAQAIINSKTVLITSNSYDYGAIQIAPNGKIYVSKEFGYDNGSDYLDIIHSPSTPGTGCTYQENGLKLLVGQSLIGLPNFPNYLFTAKPKITAQKNCATGAFDFKVENAESTASVTWNFGDPSSGVANTSQSLQPSHTFSDTGFFTVKTIFLSACGADTATLSLHIRGYQPIADVSFCKGEQVTLVGPSPSTKWNGTSTGGTYIVNQPGAVQYQFVDFYGCLVTNFVQVEEIQPITTSEQRSMCAGDTIWVFNQPVSAAGVFSMMYDAANGCDSIHTVSVAQQAFALATQSATICPGGSTTLYGTTYTQPGIYLDTIPATAGCDTALTVTVFVKSLIPAAQSATICPGGSTTLYGTTYTQPGIYLDTIPAAAGCDTALTVTIFVKSLIPAAQSATICPGGSTTLYGTTYTQPGIYLDTIPAAAGCDTALTVTIFVKSLIPAAQSATICPGGSTTLYGITYSQPGIYLDTIPAAAGCDTALTVTVFTQSLVPSIKTATICPGGSATFGGIAYTQQGIFLDTIPAAVGCDTALVVTIFVQPLVLVNKTATICPGSSVVFGGTTYSQPGTYLDTLAAVVGCDTVLTVTIIQSADTLFIPEKHSICAGDTLAVHGAKLTKAGTYAFQEPSLAACVLIYRVELELVAAPDFAVDIDPGGCNGKPIGSIQIQNPQSGWQARLGGGNWADATSFDQLPAGRYALSVRNAQGCESSDTVQVPEAPPFLLKIRLDTTFAECGVMTATASHTSQFPVRYEWQPSKGLACADCPTVELRPDQGQVYQLLAVDSAGCRAVAEVAAPGGEVYHIYAPNVFSPNDDGENDRFTLYGSRCARLIRQLSIYDRWGGQVFYKENLPLGDESKGWDGYARSQLTTPGVFTWWAEVELHSGQRVLLKGSVTVVL